MATRGPSGGGQRPRVRIAGSSGGDILQPVAERLEDVTLADVLDAFEVGRSPGYPPGPMESPSREASLLRPALEDPARAWLEPCHLSEPRRLELGVEAALASQLPGAGGDDARPHRTGAFAGRLGGKRLELDPPDADLEVDPVQQRTREPALIGRDSARRAAAA